MSLKKTSFNSFDELREYAKKHGVEISEIKLEKVSGGLNETGELPLGWNPPKCPSCGSHNIMIEWIDWDEFVVYLKCRDCGKEYYAFIL